MQAGVQAYALIENKTLPDIVGRGAEVQSRSARFGPAVCVQDAASFTLAHRYHGCPAAAEISADWVAFARTGDPNSDSRARWPRYNATEDNLINFTNSGAVQAKVPRAAALDVIASSYMP